ncbi:hypothetical protein Ancab_001463, partial [Ancistrocladus abbreviatus]
GTSGPGVDSLGKASGRKKKRYCWVGLGLCKPRRKIPKKHRKCAPVTKAQNQNVVCDEMRAYVSANIDTFDKGVSIRGSSIANMYQLFLQNQSMVAAKEVWSLGKKLEAMFEREEHVMLEQIKEAEGQDRNEWNKAQN